MVLLVNQDLNETSTAHLPQLSVPLIDVVEEHDHQFIVHLRHMESGKLGRQFVEESGAFTSKGDLCVEGMFVDDKARQQIWVEMLTLVLTQVYVGSLVPLTRSLLVDGGCGALNFLFACTGLCWLLLPLIRCWHRCLALWKAACHYFWCVDSDLVRSVKRFYGFLVYVTLNQFVNVSEQTYHNQVRLILHQVMQSFSQ